MSRAAALTGERGEPAAAAADKAVRAEETPELGNQAMQSLIAGGLRPRLEIGGADDPEEREADRLAARAMSGQVAPCACGAPSCGTCGGAKLRRKAETTASPPAAVAAGFGNRAGRPLDSGTRGHFESRFNSDFSGVRVHDDPATHSFARGIGARAFAVGNDIGFAEGRHSPGTTAGRTLIAHELAHVALGHGRVRREEEKKAAPAAAPAPAPAKVPEPPPDFDPCAVDVPSLDNRQLLHNYQMAEGYVGKLDKAKRKGEERYYDYRNLRNRLLTEREQRAASGHGWLNADLSDIPESLYGLQSEGGGIIITVARVPGSAVAANKPPGGLILTIGQFETMLSRENIPHVDIAEFFAKQDPNAPQDLDIAVPLTERRMRGRPTVDPFALPEDSAYPFGYTQAGGMSGDPARARAGFANQFLWQNGFTDPVTTAGPFGYDAAAREGFRIKWRGAMGETMFRGVDANAAASIVDLNTVEPNFPLYDYMDARTGEFGSIKTQMPPTAGGTPSLEAFLEANRELFGSADPAKRASALTKLQAEYNPAMTQEEMLRRTRFRVNPDVVVAARAAQIDAMANSPRKFDAVLGFQIKDTPVQVTLKDGSNKIYNDIAVLHSDYKAKRMTYPNYQGAIVDLARPIAQQSVQAGVGNAEPDFRPLLDMRQSHDFLNAAEFAGTPNTVPGKRDARLRQRAIYEQLARAEYLEGMRSGVRPGLTSSARTGGMMGLGTAAVADLYPTIKNWDKDPYAGRRYAMNVELSGLGGFAQGGAEYGMEQGITRGGLYWAAQRAAAGQSVAPIAAATPMSRLAGSTILGGAFSAGVTVGGMYLDESYFGADYSKIDYEAKATRAFVSGSISAGVGAVATGLVTAKLVGGGGAAGCTVVVPGVGTVACGTVGAGVGFLVGVATYYIADWATGDAVENKTRDVLGEQGCKK